jgi:hypothetical protein
MFWVFFLVAPTSDVAVCGIGMCKPLCKSLQGYARQMIFAEVVCALSMLS